MKPIIVIPMGDPAGIGPEIVAKALSNEEIFQCARCVVTGDKKVMEQAVKLVKLPMDIQVIKEPEEGRFEKNVINLIDLDNVDMAQFKLGEISAMCGQAAYEYIAESIFLANSGKADAVSTTPINKESLRAAGVPFIGHTEIFGALTNTPDPLTMFEVRNMRVFFLTRHVSLKQACDMITKERVVDYVKRCTRALCQLGAEAGTMAIAGLNPHSGEHGLFGNEELDAIYPAVEELQDKGYKVVGPVGADSVFHLALRGKFNSVLSLYHDQGHIATKTLDFERTIAVTAGMPILRTSVDHGTAMDIAGTGLASDVSMVEAIRLAARYSPSFVKK